MTDQITLQEHLFDQAYVTTYEFTEFLQYDINLICVHDSINTLGKILEFRDASLYLQAYLR